jgi:hypothetical protein
MCGFTRLDVMAVVSHSSTASICFSTSSAALISLIPSQGRPAFEAARCAPSPLTVLRVSVDSPAL